MDVADESRTAVDCVLRVELDIAQSHAKQPDSDTGSGSDNVNEAVSCVSDGYVESVANIHSELEGEEVKKFLYAVVHGDFLLALTSSIGQTIIGKRSTSTSDSCVVDVLQDHLQTFVNHCEHPDEAILRQFLVLCVGVASLQLFVQNNWTGPPTTQGGKKLLQEIFSAIHGEVEESGLSKSAKAALSEDDSSIYPLVCLPQLLLLARWILVDSCSLLGHCKTSPWWQMRCLWVQQQVLDQRSPQLYNLIMPLIETIRQDEILMSPEKDPDIPVTFHLECSHICAFYYEYKMVSECLDLAKKLAGLEDNLTGALGKRTRFQEDDKAQLVLRVTREEGEGQTSRGQLPSPCPKGLPKDLNLDDDTVLNSIKFKEDSEGEMPDLTSVEQALIISICMEHKRSKPKDVLLKEELMSYIVGALRQPRSWAVQTVALRLRCHLEKEKRRTVERAMMQMQVLVDQVSDTACRVTDRLHLFYASNLPPKWTIERDLAELLMSLGCVSDALEIFVRLHLWEDVVDCYKTLGNPQKAIHVIEEELAVKETALMWCLLGDVTREKEYYEKAWEASGHRSSRAQASLGLVFINDEDYDKAIDALELSLEKNFLQYQAWFNLGYAAFQAERYETAARACRKCVLLDSDNAQSWNNLAISYIKLNQKPKAFRTLQESLKCNYENWKVWDNYLGVSMDLGEFDAGLKAYGRLLELRQKHVDEAVLGVMVRVVTENVKDCRDKPASLLRPKMLDLFEKLTSEVTNNGIVWSLYAKLLGSCATENPVDNDKALQCLQRAHRLVTQDQNWVKEVAEVERVIDQSLTLTQAYEHCSGQKSSSSQAIQLLASAKLMMKAILSQVKQEYYNPVVTSESWKQLEASVHRLETKLQEVLDRIAQLKGG